MRKVLFRALVAAVLGVSLLASACGSTGGGGSSSSSKGTITIGAQSFSENATLSYIYGGVLKDQGYTVKYRENLGQRSVVAPALERGDIQLYPGYTASDLEFYDQNKGLAGTDAQQNADKLNSIIQPKGLTALAVSPAADQNAFAVTKQTANKYHLKSLSDLAPVAGQLTLGGPVDCPSRPDCQAGLASTYGVHFQAFKALDSDGPLTHTALQNGQIQVALVFSTDGIIASNHWVILADPKHIVNADHVVPIIRTKSVNSSAQQALNKVSAKLTTDQLVQMNLQTDVEKSEPQSVAQSWLKSHGYSGKTS
ncbi:MAG: ABC transporter substrate-binding protein [Candidatus Dormiibacterota bacterium]